MTFQIFSFIFIAVALAGFYLINPRYRLVFLSVCSLVFVYLQDPVALFVFIGITLITYISGLAIGKLSGSSDKTTIKRIVFILTIIIYVPLFVFWKIGPAKSGVFSNIIIPIGFSFYTFQAISYISNIYTGKTGYESDPVRLLFYMSWFPKFVCGPIERS